MISVSLPVTYRNSRLKTLFLFAASLVFATGGLAMSSDQPLAGYSIAVFFGVAAIVFAVNLHPNASFLELTEKGFTICSSFRRAFISWEDVRVCSQSSQPDKSAREMNERQEGLGEFVVTRGDASEMLETCEEALD